MLQSPFYSCGAQVRTVFFRFPLVRVWDHRREGNSLIAEGRLEACLCMESRRQECCAVNSEEEEIDGEEDTAWQ